MTEEIDIELQARLEAAADRIAPKADRLEKVQRDGAHRRERRRRVVSASAVVLFVAALGAGAFALSTIGDEPLEVLAAREGDGSADPSVESSLPPSDQEDGGSTPAVADGDGSASSTAAETSETRSPATGTVVTTPDSDSTDPTGDTGSSTGMTGTTVYDEGGTTSESTTPDGDTTGTTGEANNDPVTLTTIPVPPDAGPQLTWEHTFDFGAVQQWLVGNQDCVRLYSPITRDPARSEATILRQSTFEACFGGATTIDSWYVARGNPSHMMFLMYALPPHDPVAVWVTDESGYRVPGFVDGEFWGIDAYWSSKPVAVHIQRSNGEVVSIDLPAVSQQSDVLRLYIGRPIALG